MLFQNIVVGCVCTIFIIRSSTIVCSFVWDAVTCNPFPANYDIS